MKPRSLALLSWLCLLGPMAQQATAAEGPAQQAMARIQALIGDASCRSDAQCRTIAVGQRACGGPEMYLAWSTRRTALADLERAVAAFEAASQPALPGRSASICVFLHDPGAVCRRMADPAQAADRCQLRPASNAGAGLPVR